MLFRFFNWYIKIIDSFNEWVGNKVAWLTTALVLLVCYDVVMRYFFNSSSAGLYELEWHIFSAIFLLGAAFTLKHDRHVRVDVFYSNFSETQKAWVNLIGTLVFLIPLCYVIIDASSKFVLHAYRFNEGSADAGGLPNRYIIKSAIPIGFLLLLLQAFSMLFKSILTVFNKNKLVNH